MQTIQNFSEMVRHLSASGQKITIAVACGDDDSTLQAVTRALASGFARAIFVGDASVPRAYAPMQEYAELVEFVEPETAEPAAAAALAVRLVREGRAGILMKGLISTDILLRAVLNKAEGLLPPGKVLTHLAVAQIPGRDRLLFFTDAAVIPYPTAEQRAAQIGYVASVCRKFGIAQPRISLIHCSEHVSEKFPHTLTYADLSRRASEGEWGPAIVDAHVHRPRCPPHQGHPFAPRRPGRRPHLPQYRSGQYVLQDHHLPDGQRCGRHALRNDLSRHPPLAWR